jgi:hypothetical protein
VQGILVTDALKSKCVTTRSWHNIKKFETGLFGNHINRSYATIMNMPFTQKKQIYLATSFLLLGSAVYILFRPTSLLMFRWADNLCLMVPIHALRIHCISVTNYLPHWFIYSSPFAFWVVAYLLFIKAIWWKSITPLRYFWFWCVPLISVISEIGQYLRLIPGTFDPVDLLIISLYTTFLLSTDTLCATNVIRRLR